MTNSEKKRYLMRYRILSREIDRLLLEQQEWRSLAERVTGGLGSTGGGRQVSHPVARAVERMVEIERKINDTIDQLIRVREEIEVEIDALPNPTLRRLLSLRYLSGFTWERIAVEMGYTYQWVCKLHSRALSCFQTVDSN